MPELPTNEELVAQLRDLPAMPQVVAELIASLDDDDVDLDTLAEKISQSFSLMTVL